LAHLKVCKLQGGQYGGAHTHHSNPFNFWSTAVESSDYPTGKNILKNILNYFSWNKLSKHLLFDKLLNSLNEKNMKNNKIFKCCNCLDSQKWLSIIAFEIRLIIIRHAFDYIVSYTCANMKQISLSNKSNWHSMIDLHNYKLCRLS